MSDNQIDLGHQNRSSKEARNGLPRSARGAGHIDISSKEVKPVVPAPAHHSPDERARITIPASAGHDPISLSVGEICLELIGLQQARCFAIVSQSRCNRSTEAFVCRTLGYVTPRERRPKKGETVDEARAAERKRAEAERKKLVTQAKALIEQVEKAEMPIPAPDPVVVDIITRNALARISWDEMRSRIESEMKSLARQLPVYWWVEGIRGASDLGLAVVIGEAGNLSNYPDHGRLWARLGLHTKDGMRQGIVPAGLSKEDRAAAWKERGYSPHRRAQVYAFFDDIMFRHQWAADKDEDGKNPLKTGKAVAVPAHATGPYGQQYARKKAEYVARDHDAPDRAARRYMAKMFIRHLWRAWNRKKDMQ